MNRIYMYSSKKLKQRKRVEMKRTMAETSCSNLVVVVYIFVNK